MRWRTAFLLALVCITGPARAQEPVSTPAPQVLSFTVSGGVSLGAFEAGVLYFLSEAITRSEGGVDLRIATGASAGSANALIALMDGCSPPVEDPAQSLGFQTWIPVGMEQLLDPKQVTAISVLTRQPLREAMARVAKRWRAGLRADCDVVLGVSVTRKKPTRANLNDAKRGAAVEVPRSSEQFVVRIQGRGAGRAPLLSNYVDAHAPLPQPLLQLSAAEDDTSQMRNFDQLLELLYASAAFPLAFAPKKVAHCVTDPRPDGSAASLRCEHPMSSLFIDGGVFDNTPLRLNYRVVQHGLRSGPKGQVRWLDPTTIDESKPPPVRYSYVDPATGDFPVLDVEDEDAPASSALVLAARVGKSFIETARRRELLALLEDNNAAHALSQTIGVTQNQLPTISSQLGAFFGFFERDFRELDFYIGMYDGLASVRRFLKDRAAPEEVETRLVKQFPALQQPLRKDLPKGLLPFACLLSQVEARYASLGAACDGPQLRNFRILLQVTLDRLYAACSRTEAKLPPQASPLCFDAAQGKPRVIVRGVTPLPEISCTREKEELDFAYSLRLLSEYGFAYRDLGLKPDEAQYGLVKIRRKMLEVAMELADAQPDAVNQALVVTAGRVAVNQILYEPPRNLMYVTAGTSLEVGASLSPFEWNQSWLTLNLALQMSNWETIFTPGHTTIAFSPMLGPEFQLLFMSTPTLQWMVGARAGYQFSVNDLAGLGACVNDNEDGDARNCNQFVTQAYVATALIERLRAQLAFEIFPIDNKRIEHESHFALQFTFGLQLF
ncbi:MAG TPA: patatin-like phospholipase family protein [Polyangiales bacterium]|nr:patatin-like phospholipase family protein [Polyangiales bacterium]